MLILKIIIKNASKSFLIFGLIFLSFTIYFYLLCKKKSFEEQNSLYFIQALDNQNENDIFNEKTAKIKSIEELVRLIDKRVVEKNDYQITKEIQQVVRESFVHGISYLFPCENWFLFLISQIPLKKIQQKNFNAILDPERQIKTPIAFCSQNALIIQSLLNHYKIEYSSIAVSNPPNGHFASAAKLNGVWYYLDGNIEYNLIDQKLVKLSDFLNPNNDDLIHQMYHSHPALSDSIIKGRKTGETYQFSLNKFPALKGLLFQKLTKIISNWAWLIFFILYFATFKFRV